MLPRFCWKKFRNLTEEQKGKLEQAFAVNRVPDKATIASVSSELQLEKARLKEEFFDKCRRKMELLAILHSMKKKLNQYCWKSIVP